MAILQWFGLVLLLLIGGLAWAFLRPGPKSKPGTKHKSRD
jgi:hypothetical protein